MKVWTKLQPEELRKIATELGMKIYNDHEWNHYDGIRKDGRAWNFRLSLDSSEKKDGYSRYQRTSTSYFNEGRKIAAVCWHGYRDYMLEVFRRDPEARIKTAYADYKGIEGFRENYPETGHRNMGSMMNPVMAAHACACSHSGWIVDLSIYPDMSRYQIKQTVMQSCPHFIMVPEHYRADGTCKCDDPEHQAMMIREWGYTADSFAT